MKNKLCVLILLLCSWGYLVGQADITVTVNSYSDVEDNTQIQVEIDVSGIPAGLYLEGFDGTVAWDNRYLTFVSAQAEQGVGDFTLGQNVVDQGDNTSARSFMASAQGDEVTNGTIMTWTFTYDSEDTGECAFVRIDNSLVATYWLSSDWGAEWTAELIDGEVCGAECDPPTITSHPVGATKCEGESHTFSITATGDGLNYQWKKNGTNISGAPNSNQYTINNITESDAGDYTCEVSGNCGSETSNVATLVVNVLPSQPILSSNSPICTGENAVFTISGTIGDIVTYEGVSGNPASPVTIGAGGTVDVTVNNATTNQTLTITEVSNGDCSINPTGLNETITVHPNASIGSIDGTSPICIGETETFTVNDAVYGGSGTGEWSSTNSSVASVNTSGVVTGVSDGFASILYTITGGCGGEVSESYDVNVIDNNSITLTSDPATDNQTICIGSEILNITYETTGASGASFSGLPPGVNGNWANNEVTISGTPTNSNTFNYTVTLIGGCGNISENGTITVNPENTITLTSAAGTNNQTICINEPIANITYDTEGALGANITGLPDGVNGVWSNNEVTISGTPVENGTFDYTITLTGGCGNISAEGTITINIENTIELTSPSDTDDQEVCQGSSINNITYVTTSATGASFSGLPAGVNGNWASNVVTISGSPTVSGTFNYTVTLIGGCGDISASGEIDITETPNLTISQISCDDNLTTYTVDFTNTIGDVTSTDGTIDGNSIIDIPVGTNITITADNNGCTDEATVNSPNCDCDDVSVPAVTNPQHQAICEGEANPALSVDSPTPTEDFQVNWYNVSVGGVPLVENTTTYTSAETAPGSYSYFVEVVENESGCTSDRIEVNFTIHAVPLADNPDDVDVCESYELPALTNGNYFTEPNGGGSQISAGTVITTSQTLYVFAESGTTPNCTNENSFDITIHSTPTIFGQSDQNHCESYTLPTINGSNLTGNQAYYTEPNGSGTLFNVGETIDFDDFDNYPVTLYIYDIIGTCYAEESFELTLYEQPVINIINYYCNDDLTTYTVELEPTVGELDATAGEVDGSNVINIPLDSDVMITWHNGECSSPTIFFPAPDCECADIDIPMPVNPQHAEICEGTSNPELSVELPMQSDNLQINWFDSDFGGTLLASNTTTYTPTETAPGVHSFYAEVEDTDLGCSSDRVEVKLTIFDNPTITGVFIVCEIGSTTELIIEGGSGEDHPVNAWSSNNNNIATVDNGIVTGVALGNAIITYMDSNGCSDMEIISVIEEITPSFTQLGPYCVGDTPDELPTVSEIENVSGTWSPETINTGAAGETVYTFTPDPHQCAQTVSMTIEVLQNPDASITEVSPLCTNDDEIVLIAATSGGIWSGPGITDENDGIFNPEEANIGDNTISYEVSDGQCSAIDQITITVNENADATIDPVDPVCYADTVIYLMAATPGGIWSGNGITDSIEGHFSVSEAGVGEHEIIYLISGNCGDSDTILINIFPNDIDAGYVVTQPLCVGSADGYINFAITGGTEPYTLRWNDNVSETNYMSSLSQGEYNVTIVDDNNCSFEIENLMVHDGTNYCIDIPDAFTPNGDGINDEWIIENIEFYEEHLVEVFNKWGQKVYSARLGEQPWDGTLNNKNLPTGSYVYVISLNENADPLVGTVTIIR